MADEPTEDEKAEAKGKNPPFMPAPRTSTREEIIAYHKRQGTLGELFARTDYGRE